MQEPTTNGPIPPANPYERSIPQPTRWTQTIDDPHSNATGIDSVRFVSLITGDGSPNRTRERFNVGGTDLGIPFSHQNRLYLWFGDSYVGSPDGHPMLGGLWRCNLLAMSDARDFSEGLSIDDMVSAELSHGKLALELIPGKKEPGVEHTVIPTGALSINNTIYTYYMNIKEWGVPGNWTINFCSLAVSENNGQTFSLTPDLKLDPTHFGQVAPIQVGDMIYGLSVGHGRYGDAYLLRVDPDRITDADAYEYFVTSGWTQDPLSASPIFTGPVGEPSIMYNAYLEQYIAVYLDEIQHAIVMRTATELTGPWSDTAILADAKDYPALYGGFVHEALTAHDGQTFYFIMSQWDPIYNSLLFEVNLKSRNP